MTSNYDRHKRRLAAFTLKGMDWALENLPPGVRFVVGLFLMVGGVFGFLPIVGFWMFPLGLGFVALDIPPLRHRVLGWLARTAAPMND
ncbi:MAG: hypothetical protein IID55_03850 [Proteobacteria bacterium]|nr:hypothetical protein [Pseudomonadota bacterium]